MKMQLLKVKKTVNKNQFRASYALNSIKGIRKLLKDQFIISNRRYKGDTKASDILLDLNMAIEQANLTKRQAETFILVYGYRQLPQQQASEILGISQKQVSTHLQGALTKITQVYKDWNYNEVEVKVCSDHHSYDHGWEGDVVESYTG
ncbi:sigma factor-like helix-turn-helix DNA-binding protein [Chengkuizengella axinellae]|uniref:Sigma factor-like helix-turn-helix DNA-binding protein n=1 Tax=Chengkuizengella axinellae TaxID=3064388 RepID=A0ABT9J258_9BACL|nr:sigma factor-like helix-turn-helix DNA-binding protein [Chengkuizengella sp. 2205SS18-9]MDP5275692.1 sigma factor-like helix-turn-helix DNA-binding protein [Chengkuizengella sp. 2205SS18-9]